MLNWINGFSIFCFLDNNNYDIAPHNYELVVAAGAKSSITSTNKSFSEIDHFIKGKGWVFGHLSYDLKNEFFTLPEPKCDSLKFPLFFFFESEVVITLKSNVLTIEATDPHDVFNKINEQTPSQEKQSSVTLNQRLTKEEYISKIQALQEHIHLGDCYEINFCQEFYAEDALIDPLAVYKSLAAISPMPFGAFYKLDDKYLLCASPERFLCKEGNTITAQPIKGTAKRNKSDATLDEEEKANLRKSQKEQAENVMIVDLMRNDLSKISADASVHVPELFGIYTFPQVHQMISTISGTVKEDISFSQIITATFPMGSMTGAPKKRVVELIDEYEVSARGLFSGSVGYIHNGDFDFNVVIRSLLYNASTKYLSYHVGSGITFYSQPEKEWEECLLKAEGMRKALGLQ